MTLIVIFQQCPSSLLIHPFGKKNNFFSKLPAVSPWSWIVLSRPQFHHSIPAVRPTGQSKIRVRYSQLISRKILRLDFFFPINVAYLSLRPWLLGWDSRLIVTCYFMLEGVQGSLGPAAVGQKTWFGFQESEVLPPHRRSTRATALHFIDTSATA